MNRKEISIKYIPELEQKPLDEIIYSLTQETEPEQVDCVSICPPVQSKGRARIGICSGEQRSGVGRQLRGDIHQGPHRRRIL